MTAPPRSTKQGIAGIESIGRVFGGAAQWHDPHVSQPGVERASLCLPWIHPMRRAAPSSLSISQTCLPLLCCALQAVPEAPRRDLPCWLLVGEGGWAERAPVAHRAAALQEPDTVCSSQSHVQLYIWGRLGGWRVGLVVGGRLKWAVQDVRPGSNLQCGGRHAGQGRGCRTPTAPSQASCSSGPPAWVCPPPWPIGPCCEPVMWTLAEARIQLQTVPRLQPPTRLETMGRESIRRRFPIV